jgi:hypothetical protein
MRPISELPEASQRELRAYQKHLTKRGALAKDDPMRKAKWEYSPALGACTCRACVPLGDPPGGPARAIRPAGDNT